MRPDVQTAASDRVRRGAVFVALCLAAAAALWALAARLNPPPLADASGARLPCVSYAPFRRDGHSPFAAGLRVTPQQIEEDLRLLATVTGCVRTYGIDNGLDAVPEVARRLGLRVALGAWVSRDAAANERQLDRALALAQTHRDVVERLIVGNEVLLRRELSPDALASLLERARAASPVPVTYADVWEFWLRHGDVLRAHVDLVAIHVLPYWEDHPVANAQAAAHVHDIVRQVRAALAPLPVWVAETGWPAEGRQRGPARPGAVEQTRLARDLVRLEREAPVGFNLIEGFDQPWKRQLEGAMGGYWGLFDADGAQRVRFTGAPPRDAAAADAARAAMGGGVLGLAGVLAAALVHRRRPSVVALVLGLPIGAALAAGAALQGHALAVGAIGALAFGLAAAASLCAAAVALLEAPALCRRLAGAPVPPPRRGIAAALATGGAGAAERVRALALAGLLFLCAVDGLQLVFDGRYRPLLWPMLWLPATLLLAQRLLGQRLADGAREERLLAAVCAACALVLPWLEGWNNGQALAAAASWLALASVAWPHRTSFSQGSAARPGTPASADSSRPVAATPAE